MIGAMCRWVQLVLVMVFGWSPLLASGQEKAADGAEGVASTSEALKTLASVRESLDLVSAEVKAKQQELSEATEAEKDRLISELRALNEQYAKLERDFEAISTGVDFTRWRSRSQSRSISSPS